MDDATLHTMARGVGYLYLMGFFFGLAVKVLLTRE